MSDPARWPRPLLAFAAERLSRLEAACRSAQVPFHDDAGVDERLLRVLLASDFAWRSYQRDPQLLAPDALRLMSDPRHADARAGVFDEARDAATLRSLLRSFHRREALRLVWRDVNADDGTETILTGASLLAQTCIEQALRGAERQVAERHGVVRDAHGRVMRLVVVGMGKLGGGELNFSSDIDLILAYDEDGMSDGARPLDAAAWFTRVGQALVSLLADHDADGYVYRVDLRLRPFGNAGRLALSFAAMEHYYQREGRDWERYAWIKAGVVAGDRAAGARLLALLRPFVYRRYLDYGAFAGLREMKALIDAEVARKDLAANLKLGPGGIREIEFIVQLAQLIRGGREPTLRVRGLLPALAACSQRGLMPIERARELREAYLLLRRVENRVQMFDDQQCHALPDDALARARIAVALGHRDAAALDAALERQRAVVAEQFAALMAVEARSDAQRTHAQWAQLWHELRDADEVDPAVLAAAGFVPAAEVAGELQALLGSVTYRNMSTRSRERLERVMPALLAAAAAQGAAVPCLLRLLRLVQAVARRSVYLALLDEQPAALRRVSTVFAASAFLAERVIAHPLLLDDLFDDRIDPDWTRREALEDELARRLAALGQADSEAEIELIQEVRQSALFRLGLAFLGAQLDAVATARALADVAAVVLAAVLRIAERDLQAIHGRLPTQAGKGSGLAIIAYGSFGGGELGFGSDLDLVFLYDGELAQGESDGARPLDAPRWYARLAQRVVHLLGVLTRAGRLYEVDVRLRPDGSKGMLVLSLAAFEAYQRERAWTWELQALVRARAVAGDVALSRRFAQLRDELLALPREAARVRSEVAAMRARWRGERDRSDERQFDLKQGAGGLVDIEFLLQALVLIHAPTHALLADTGNSARLIALLGEVGVLTSEDAGALAQAHMRLLARAIGCTLDAQARIVMRDADIEAAAAVVRALAARMELPLSPAMA